MKGLSREAFIEKGCLDIERFEKGIEQYPSLLISGADEVLYRFLEKCIELNDGQAYVDFYYPVLTKEEQLRFYNQLTPEEQAYLMHFEHQGQYIYYPLTEDNLGFLAGITARELLFSTFYFAGYKAAVWGNYGLRYPMFCFDNETRDKYQELAVQCGLTTGGI